MRNGESQDLSSRVEIVDTELLCRRVGIQCWAPKLAELLTRMVSLHFMFTSGHNLGHRPRCSMRTSKGSLCFFRGESSQSQNSRPRVSYTALAFGSVGCQLVESFDSADTV
jgi:hypothetical protein